MKRKVEEQLLSILSSHVPENAVGYCFELWKTQPFHFIVTRERATKLGDYRFDARYGDHAITVNHNLNPYSFLITFIHEVAHQHVKIKIKKGVTPHGSEWKAMFRDLMIPLLNDQVFPDDVLRVLARHMKNPKASSQSDTRLAKVLHTYDENSDIPLYLDQLSLGAEFTFKGRFFKKLENKRTRVLCLDLHNGKRYLIPKIANVEAA